MDGVIAEHQERRAAGAGNDEDDLLDVLLRIQKDGSLQVSLDMGIIRAVIIVSSALFSPNVFDDRHSDDIDEIVFFSG